MINSTDISLAEYTAGRYRHAVQFAQYALARDTEDAQAWLVLGRSLMKCYEFIGAIDAFENASLLQPLANENRISMARAYGAVGRKSLSRDLLMCVATSQSVTVSELLQIAVALEAIDEPHFSMEACRQAGKKAPETAEVHYQMGYYAQQCGHPASVSEALIRNAIDLDPRNIHFRIGLASMLIRLGQKRKAIAVIDHLIPSQLDEVTCLCCLKRIANLFFDVDDIERAKMCAERLAELGGKVDATPSSSHSISM